MKILFLDAYFYPESIAFSHLEKDLIECLVKAGHEVEVITPTPTRGIDQQTYESYRKRMTEIVYGATVYRFKMRREGKNPIARALRYLMCNVKEYQLAAKCKGIDLVFCNSTPPTQGILAGMVAKKFGCPFVYSLQDIFPDSLVTTGLSKRGSLMWRIGSFLEKITYAKADSIVTISESCKRNLLQKGVDVSKIQVVSNWIDADVVRPVPDNENRLMHELGIDSSKFRVVYAGNFGAAQGADVILEAAKLLEDHKHIEFLLFSNGAKYEEARRRYIGLKNVRMLDLQPQERVPEVYSLADVVLITCKPGTASAGMPSKTWSIMACNKPIIAAFDRESELEAVLKDAQTGVCVEPGNAEELAVSIIQASEKCNVSSDINGRDYVYLHASRGACTERYRQIMEHEVEKGCRV